MNDTPWIKLNSSLLNAPRQEIIGGTVVSIQLSPHDVPTALRGCMPEAGGSKKFIVEFRYIDDEPWRAESNGQGIVMRVGRHSGRLYGIEIDESALGALTGPLQVELRVPEVADLAIDRIAERETNLHGDHRIAIEHFKAAKAAIASARENLFCHA